MLIVCTRDKDIRNFTCQKDSGSGDWSQVYLLPADLGRKEAKEVMAMLLMQLGVNEPLCFSAHGNDHEIGDAGNTSRDWGWKPKKIAKLLKNIPDTYTGKILIHACARDISNFSTRLVLALEEEKALNGVWVFGYNIAIDSYEPYPAPDDMFNKSEQLQWAQVVYTTE